jgi:hypothetical protein
MLSNTLSTAYMGLGLSNEEKAVLMMLTLEG